MTDTIPNGQIVVINHATIHKNGLEIESGLAKEDWIKGVLTPLKRLINTMEESALWWWGDALAYGEKNYGSTYTQALEQSGYTYGTLRNAKMVSERVPFVMRHDNLTWSHHAEVAMAVDDEQQRSIWLSSAAAKKMSKSELRKAIRMSKAEYNDQPNEDAGQCTAINAAKTLCSFLEQEDFTAWKTERRQAWIADLRPIALAYAQLVGSSTA